MTYKIVIEGGFTGITKKYEGSIELDASQTDRLLQIMTKKDKEAPTSTTLRDGQNYHITLVENTKEYSSVYSDKNMPEEIRSLLEVAKRND